MASEANRIRIDAPQSKFWHKMLCPAPGSVSYSMHKLHIRQASSALLPQHLCSPGKVLKFLIVPQIQN